MDTAPNLTDCRSAVVDEFGALSRERDAWTPKGKRLATLTDEIRAWYPNLAPDQTAVERGKLYEIQIGEQTIEKSWKSIAACAKATGGWVKFQHICTVTFKALSDVLGNSAAEALQVEARTGYRKLKAVALELPKAA